MNMLRNIKFYLSAFAILVSTTSCLDKYPGSSIPEKEAMRTFADAEQTLTGIYASLKSNALYSGYLTLLPDIQADLVYAVEGNTNTYGSFWRWDIRPTDLQLEAVYAALYKVIGNCNFYLDRIDEVMANEISDTNIEKLEQYTGEVYAVRALCYTERSRPSARPMSRTRPNRNWASCCARNTLRPRRHAAHRSTTRTSSYSTTWPRPRNASTRRTTPTATST